MLKIHSLRPVAPLIGAAAALAGLLAAAALATGSSPALAQDRTTPATAPASTRATTPAVPAAAKVASTTRANLKGGYTVQVPQGMRATSTGPTTQIVTPDKSLVVTVAPTVRVDPALGNARVIAAMEKAYRSVRTTRHEPGRIDGRPAITSYGTAVTKQGLTLRFALVSVRGLSSSYAISTFAAADSDQATVLPRVQTIVNELHIG